MNSADARRLFKSAAKNIITMKLISRTSGALESRPVVTYENVPVRNVMVSSITDAQRMAGGGTYRDADLLAAFVAIDLPGRDEFKSAGRLDTGDRAIALGCECEIVNARRGEIAGLPVIFLYLKRTFKEAVAAQ
ncbi:MAG: hypothetical protein KDK41_11930 [Leptospiraceae bacterium]|nr:hypothetical protein [Leptospiraceae bacterium]